MKTSPSPAPPVESTRWVAIAAAGIAAAAVGAYSGSFSGPFLYDDLGSIPQNTSLRHLATAFLPPAGGMPISGRPIVNASFAINYAISGTAVWSYHAGNLLIHVLAALFLFGIVRRIGRSTAAGFAVALLWAVHPLQTEAVTYLAQRAESLMGLFYLASLYCFIRLAERDGEPPSIASRTWAFASWAACLVGMGAKEVMVTAPAVILLCDRAFFTGSFRESWRRRRGYYAGLALAWIPLAALVAGSGSRGGTAGFGTGVAPWAYALTQFRAIAIYLRLSLWPHPLVADYGRILGGPPLELVLQALLVVILVAVAAVLLVRRRPAGFVGACFFLILAPSSSVVPVATELIAEHRMYLSLAAVIAGVVFGVRALLRRIGPVLGLGWRGIGLAGALACVLAAAVLGAGTFRRNRDYQSNLVFWGDVAAKVPMNAGAHSNYGNALAESGSVREAIGQYREALFLAPDYADAHFNLGNALKKEGRLPEAIDNYVAALRFRPADAMMHHGYGLALLASGRLTEAQREFEQAVQLYEKTVRLTPDLISAHYDLANLLEHEGNREGAAAEFKEALALNPDYAEAWYNLANVQAETGRLAEASDSYAAALRSRPGYVDAQVNYGNILAQMGRVNEAVAEFQAALQSDPGAADIHNNLGGLLAQNGRLAEARTQFEEALRLKPDYREARDNLERVRLLEREGVRP